MPKKINSKGLELPTTSELELALSQEKYKYSYKKLLISTINVLIIVSAISVLIATLLFPVLKIYGKSMAPTLTEGDIVVSIKDPNLERGDVIAFYYNNQILVKRVIATSSQWVNIDKAGNVFVNDELLSETYIKEKAYGENDITYPYQVPEDSYFVLGDQRATSVDSRNLSIGAVSKEDIIGKVIFKVWPLSNLSIVT